MKIKTNDNKGISLTCSDGYTFSMQFGAGNYCSNYNNRISEQFLMKNDTESGDCEVAVFDEKGNWITAKYFENSDGQVVGYIPIEIALKKALDHEKSLLVLKYIKED
jgi:hypothetical protein